jgi:putative Holliday junction resolvase
MGRVLGIDFGLKRSGIAVTDPLQIVVNGLDTVETPNLRDFLSSYLQSEDVEKVVIGLPVHTDGSYTSLKEHIDALATFIKQSNPDTHIDFEDESFTSMKAKEVIFQSGVRKKKRRDKKLVDKISAVLILQKYLKHI